jgi:hypothetical protein
MMRPFLHNRDKCDVYSIVKGKWLISYDLSVKTKPFIKNLIEKFSKMRKAWYVYTLTDKQQFFLEGEDSSKLHM